MQCNLEWKNYACTSDCQWQTWHMARQPGLTTNGMGGLTGNMAMLDLQWMEFLTMFCHAVQYSTIITPVSRSGW